MLSWLSSSSTVTLTTTEIAGAILLFLSLVGNAFQVYQQRTAGRTIYNGIVGLFNSIGWLLEREIEKGREIDRRLTDSTQMPADAPTAMREFREFTAGSHIHLRVLHEELVAVAKTVRATDQRWEGHKFGMSADELAELQRKAMGR